MTAPATVRALGQRLGRDDPALPRSRWTQGWSVCPGPSALTLDIPRPWEHTRVGVRGLPGNRPEAMPGSTPPDRSPAPAPLPHPTAARPRQQRSDPPRADASSPPPPRPPPRARARTSARPPPSNSRPARPPGTAAAPPAPVAPGTRHAESPRACRSTRTSYPESACPSETLKPAEPAQRCSRPWPAPPAAIPWPAPGPGS